MKLKYQHYLMFFLAFVAITMTVYAELPAWPTQNATPVSCNFGYKEVATPTITLTDSTAVSLDDYLP